MSHTDVERSTHADGTEVSDERGAARRAERALARRRRALTTVLRSRELSIFLVLVAVVVLATAKNEQLPVQLRRLAQLPAQPVDPAAARRRPGAS